MFTVHEIAACTEGRIIGPENGFAGGVSTDSRSIMPGDLFVPLKGERFDGHQYIKTLEDNETGIFLVEESWLASSDFKPRETTTIVAVPDTLRALGDLAAYYRKRFAIPVAAITGSNGKTTTKEMLSSILSVKGPGLKTEGNLNNLVGLPLMLFRLSSEHHWAVLEMGMSEAGEIDRLAQIAAPSVGTVLNVFPAHLETMKSLENVARAKGELFMRLPEDGIAVVNNADPHVAVLPIPAGTRKVTFGTEDSMVTFEGLQILGVDGQRFILHAAERSCTVHLHAFGRHSVVNAIASAAAALALGCSLHEVQQGLENFRPYDRRFKLERVGSINLIDDSYNANPASMSAALLTAAELKGSRRLFAVLGDMLELGSNADEMHRQVLEAAMSAADRIFLAGDLMRDASESFSGSGTISVGLTRGEIAAELVSSASPGDFVLVKGSRGMRMDMVSSELRKLIGQEA